MPRRQQARIADDESYFVSMTDLMIGLLFIFIIMLMSFTINFRQAETRSQEEELKSRRLQVERNRTIERLTDNQKTLEHILRSIERSLSARRIQVKVFPRTGILRLPEDILFDSGSAQLNARGQQSVAALAAALETVIPCHAEMPVPGQIACDPDRHGRIEALLIEGHTDNVPVRSSTRFRSNWDLSAARAIATFDELVMQSHLGIARNDHDETLIGVSGYGEERWVEPNETEEGRRPNRRIDLRFLMAVPERPGTQPPEIGQ